VGFTAAKGRVWETDEFLYLPVIVNYKRGNTIERDTVMFALSNEIVVTQQPAQHFTLFDKAIAKMRPPNRRGTMSRMNAAEEIVSRIQETQLQLARAARHLLADTPARTADLDNPDRRPDQRHRRRETARGFEHDKVRYLQQSVMTWLAPRSSCHRP
jgi:magnesium transporter